MSTTQLFLLPDLGEGLPDAEIVEWHVAIGQVVRLDEPLVSMETAKAVVEVPSPCSGTLLRVAGKTGTTRIAMPGGYQQRHISVFAGIVPVQQPRFAMVVAIHEPSAGQVFAGIVAAPVFQNVMDGALRLMDVPPDNVRQWFAGAPSAAPPTAGEIGSDGLVPVGVVLGPGAEALP